MTTTPHATDEDVKLLPCPFCGSKAAMCVLEDSPGDIISAWVSCGGCGVEIPERRTEADATEKWNDRAESVAPPPSPGDPDVEVECEPFYVESDVDAEGFRTNTRLVPVPSLQHSGEPVAFEWRYKNHPFKDHPWSYVDYNEGLLIKKHPEKYEVRALGVIASPPATQIDGGVATAAEIQSGMDRQQWAENLILQLPADHDGRNSWLLNYGRTDFAKDLRAQRGFKFNEQSQAINPPAAPKPQRAVARAIVTDEMVTAAMRAFERMSSVLRYREKDKWHSCDIMGMRDALAAALSPTELHEGKEAWSLAEIQMAADSVVQRVCEYDDRTSPEDFPEALLITSSELHAELVRFAQDIGALTPTPDSGNGRGES